MRKRFTSTPGPWLQHPEYPTCLATVADPRMSMLTVDSDGYGAFLEADDCQLAAQAPEMARLIQQFFEAYPGIEENEHLSGADMIQFVTLWMRDARATLDKAGVTL